MVGTDLGNGRLCEEFLQMQHIVGHPDVINIFTDVCACTPVRTYRPAGFTSDGAAAMKVSIEGVIIRKA